METWLFDTASCLKKPKSTIEKQLFPLMGRQMRTLVILQVLAIWVFLAKYARNPDKVQSIANKSNVLVVVEDYFDRCGLAFYFIHVNKNSHNKLGYWILFPIVRNNWATIFLIHFVLIKVPPHHHMLLPCTFSVYNI